MPIYFVNLSAGANGAGTSRGNPYNSLAALPTLVAGDIVEIEPGSSQTMSATYSISGSGSAGNPITIRANPAVAGAKPRLRIVSEGQVGIIGTFVSNIVLENLEIYGDVAWTSETSIGVRFNGATSNITLRRCDFRYCGVDLVGGFAGSNVRLENCTVTDNATDGVRLWSSTGTYTWSDVVIEGGTYSRNGRALSSNGAGLSSYVQLGHTGTTFQNVRVVGALIEDNYRAGIVYNNESVAYATVVSAGNTTPPSKLFLGVEFLNNTIRRNGGAGISLFGAAPSSTMGVRIASNLVEDNGARTTLGNIWTGGCTSPLIERNVCRRARTNGTTIGDGQGIFDDQWNDGAIVRWNVIENNIFDPLVNPEYSAYGIGIFRCANSKHYGNLIVGCRHGYVIGTVSGATAPVMAGIKIHGNTFVGTLRYVISIWSATPASAMSIRNNFFLGGLQDIEPQSGNAGLQTFSNNAAASVSVKFVGNNVGAGAVNHSLVTASQVTERGELKATCPLIRAGVNVGRNRDILGILRHPTAPSIGAYEPARMKRTAA